MIIRNSATCHGCGDEIESTHRHDFVTCTCGNVSVDGGRSYLRRAYLGVWTDTSIEEQFATVEALVARLRNVHADGDCHGPACPIHRASDHHMRGWMLDWKGGIVRICPHGESHPDPDTGRDCIGCDGCCEPTAAAA